MTRGFPPKLVPADQCEFENCRNGSWPCEDHPIPGWRHEHATDDTPIPTPLERLKLMGGGRG